MTIDERLERLTERHEALTQTVELIAIQSRNDNAEWRERIKSVESIVTRMAEGIAALARVVGVHEHRLENLDGGA